MVVLWGLGFGGWEEGELRVGWGLVGEDFEKVTDETLPGDLRLEGFWVGCGVWLMAALTADCVPNVVSWVMPLQIMLCINQTEQTN